MLRKADRDYYVSIKTIASKLIAVLIVALLLNMPHSSDVYFVSHDLEIENQGVIGQTTWSTADKTIDLYFRPFETSSIQQAYSEKVRTFRDFLSVFIENTSKYDLSLLDKNENYVVYSESATQSLDKFQILFPFHYFW